MTHSLPNCLTYSLPLPLPLCRPLQHLRGQPRQQGRAAARHVGRHPHRQMGLGIVACGDRAGNGCSQREVQEGEQGSGAAVEEVGGGGGASPPTDKWGWAQLHAGSAAGRFVCARERCLLGPCPALTPLPPLPSTTPPPPPIPNAGGTPRWGAPPPPPSSLLTGERYSLLGAHMPTASTSQILGNNECFEPYTSNIYVRRVLSGALPGRVGESTLAVLRRPRSATACAWLPVQPPRT